MKTRPLKALIKMPKPKPKAKLQAATRTASRRTVTDIPDEDEYYEESEPNMRLSHAFIVVLILHVIAVGGVFGFNSIKARQNSLAKLEEEASRTAIASGSTSEAGSTTAPDASATEIVTRQESAPAPVLLPGQTSYEVVAGDTLTRIATRNGISVESLMQTNGLQQDSIIRVGQTLILPAASTTDKPAGTASATQTPPTTTASPSSPATQTQTPAATVGDDGKYEVVRGDNPYSIAKRLGVSYQELLRVNGIDDPTKLQIGQKLIIPASN
jgi:LysM repeat protein